MTTLREVVRPFMHRLYQRAEELDEKMATVDTTPEEHGEKSACTYVQFELGVRLNMQEAGKLDPNWEQAFLNYLRTTHEPRNRKDQAQQTFERTYADELEQIWRKEGIL